MVYIFTYTAATLSISGPASSVTEPVSLRGTLATLTVVTVTLTTDDGVTLGSALDVSLVDGSGSAG